MKNLKRQDGSVTYFIDEFDRSLHPKLSEHLLNQYLDSCGAETRKQLIFTTQNALLVSQDLLRRDELWIANRESDGSTTLYPMTDFKELRLDKDIRKSYLEGRMGGTPNLPSYYSFRNLNCSTVSHSNDKIIKLKSSL